MFGAKYSRLAFWIWSIILMIINIPLMILSKAPIGDTEEVSTGTILLILFIFILPSIIWINTLANRIRDYGSNPWLSLWALVPLVNMGMALYYGIVRYKENPTDNNTTANSDTSFTEAVYNHTKDLAAEVKPSISEYKQKHATSQTQVEYQNVDLVDEDAIYEQVMLEIEEDKKVKSTWAKALAGSDGDKNKAEALYIKLRVQNIKKDLLEKLKNKEKNRQQAIDEFDDYYDFSQNNK